jgi:hypothetical protein
MIDLEKAVKFPFEQKGWESKLGILFLLYLFVYLISTFTNVGDGYSSTLKELQMSGEGINEQAISGFLNGAAIFTSIWAGLVSLLTIPVSLYLSGYEFTVTRNLMSKKGELLEDPAKAGDHIRLGLVKCGLSIPVVLIYIVLLVAAGIAAFGLSFLPSVHDNLVLIFLIWGVFFIFAIPLGILTYFLNTSIYYNYLKERNFWGAFNIGKVLSTLKAGWKEFLAVVGWGIVVGIGSMVINFALCCLTFIVSPAMTMYTQLVMAHLTGQAFQVLADRKI